MIVKRGKCFGTVTLSQSLYRCSVCGHVDVESSGDKGSRKCSSCGESMVLASYSEESPEEDCGRNSGE